MTAERALFSLPVSSKETSPVSPEALPRELLSYKQWICWRYVDRGKGRKPDKQPVNPRSLTNAGVHWANTWTTFDEAYDTYLRHYKQHIHGIGFVLTQADPYVAVDLDSCVHEAVIESTAAQVIAHLESYTEISPSGHGVRILVACPEFHDNRRRDAIEVYSHSRYVTVTGHHVPGAPSIIASVSDKLIAELLPAMPEPVALSQAQASRPEHYAVNDTVLWERIFAHDKYGAQHLRRFQGDSALDRGDHSFTVIRLLNCLARWTQCDAGRMRSMILMSPLVNEKWFKKRGGEDWLYYQITGAIAYVSGRKGK